MGIKKFIENRVVPHRRGIMGTVIFHLLLAIVCLGMGMSKITVHAEAELVLEAPAPERMQKREQEELRKKEIRQKSSAEEVERMLRSIAVNEEVKERKNTHDPRVEQYVEEIMRELQEAGGAGRYEVRRDKHFRKDSLLNARDRREQRLDSLKSTFYAGESSVSYRLKDRYARFLPIPVFKCEYGGTVVVEIVVNPKGVVQKAVVLKEQSRADDCLWSVAVDAAERSRFNEKPSAPVQQKGTITYHFVKQ